MSAQDDRHVVKMLVRSREDFQAMRKRNDNRIGRKANGESQNNLTERVFSTEDADMLGDISDAAKAQERELEKKLKKALNRFPIYTEYLSGIKGVGTVAAGWIIAEYDIERATTVSKLWQFTGLNPGKVRGKKRRVKPNGDKYLEITDTLVPGDRFTSGFVAPFNQRLRTAMVGVLAEGFIKAQSYYALEYYYPCKTRLAHSEKTVMEVTTKGGEPVAKPWKDTTKGHRDRAAKRYMIKMFLRDLYVAWRTLEGLPVRPSYQEEKLGHVHED